MTEEKPIIVIVEWIDSSVQNGQVNRDDFPTPVIIRSVGFLIKTTETYIVLARDDMGEGDFRGLCAIPVVVIKTRSDYDGIAATSAEGSQRAQ